MEREQLIRTRMLIGDTAQERLATAKVIVFGIGGVGGYVVEALARSGVGTLHLVDHDTIARSNLNRQIIATHDTLGRDKVDAAAERVKAINPEITVVPHKTFFLPENADEFIFSQFDFVVDAVDTVTAKLLIIEKATMARIPVISSMGTGNKLDPGALRLGDIYQTAVCPLARVMRKECRKRGIKKLPVVYSTETPITPLPLEENASGNVRKQTPGSSAFVPAAAGLMIAAEVVRTLTEPYLPQQVKNRIPVI